MKGYISTHTKTIKLFKIWQKKLQSGKSIKKIRNKLGLSQEEFAQKSGVKYTTLTKIESSVIKKPSVMVMDQIARAFGVPIEDLIK